MSVALPNFSDFPSRVAGCTGSGTSTPATPIVIGGIYTDVTDPTPTLYVGDIIVNTVADLRGVANKPTNKMARILMTSPGDPKEVVWNNDSLDADDPPNVYKPNDTLIGNPGRWEFRSL